MFGFIQIPTKGAITIFNDLKHEFSKSFSPDSHDLAHWDYEVKGEAQKQPGVEVRDLAWHQNLADMPGTLIGGVPNENLFAMIRRFNKVRLSTTHPSALSSTLLRMSLTLELCLRERLQGLI